MEKSTHSWHTKLQADVHCLTGTCSCQNHHVNWPIPVLCQNNLLLVNWIWQLLQLSKISFLRKMMYTILLTSKLMVSSQNSTLNPQNHHRSRIEGWGWRTLWCSRLLGSKFLFYNTICYHSWLPCKGDCYVFISIVTCIYMYIY